MLYTREYTVLIGKGCDNVKILPNTPIEPFEGDYVVSSYARVIDSETKEAFVLHPGQNIKGIGTVEKPKPKRKKAVKDVS